MLFRSFVFPASPTPLQVQVQVRDLLLVNLVGMALTWLTARPLVEVLFLVIGFPFHAEAIGHVVAIAAPAGVNWFGHRRFNFAQHA